MKARPEVPDPRVADLAGEVLQRACAADPTLATTLGDHRFDGELPDPSAAARDRRIVELGQPLALPFKVVKGSSSSEEGKAELVGLVLAVPRANQQEGHKAHSRLPVGCPIGRTYRRHGRKLTAQNG